MRLFIGDIYFIHSLWETLNYLMIATSCKVTSYLKWLKLMITHVEIMTVGLVECHNV